MTRQAEVPERIRTAPRRRWGIAAIVALATTAGPTADGAAAAANPAAPGPSAPSNHPAEGRLRARQLGLHPGVFAPGTFNAITDVDGVRVGHVTRIEGPDVRTGVTVIVPHGGNVFQDKVPAGIAVENAFGKLAGSTQVQELGEIETPIALTNTLSVPQAAEGLIDWTLAQPGNEQGRSVNAVVGETNDGALNDIRRRVITRDDILRAIGSATTGPVAEGSVGAGTGTLAFAWKGGIGTSSRVLPAALGGYRVGVLVQTNFGGALTMAGVPVGLELGEYYLKEYARPAAADGSLMIVIATDAPLSDRNLVRLARRAVAGAARTGSAFSNGSGDYAIAFSTAASVRRTPARREASSATESLPNDGLSPLFVAVADATEESIYDSLLTARSIVREPSPSGPGFSGKALDIERLRAVLQRHGIDADVR
jgi:D-aminopeptidase